jgi:hypothetical protein
MDLEIEDGNKVDDDFMELEDTVKTMLKRLKLRIASITPARSAPEATAAVSAGATVARSASVRFPRPMVSPWLRDKPMSNNLDKYWL